MDQNNGSSAFWKDLRRDYLRSWRRKHPEKVKQYNREYWERKAREKAAQGKSKEGETNAENKTI